MPSLLTLVSDRSGSIVSTDGSHPWIGCLYTAGSLATPLSDEWAGARGGEGGSMDIRESWVGWSLSINTTSHSQLENSDCSGDIIERIEEAYCVDNENMLCLYNTLHVLTCTCVPTAKWQHENYIAKEISICTCTYMWATCTYKTEDKVLLISSIAQSSHGKISQE